MTRTLRADVVVVGGGLGGVAAALAACRAGRSVLLTEETDWLGGQLTSQAVPPDEHPWVERFGVTASYRALRDGVRAYYRAHYPLTTAAAGDRYLNPGAGLVSKLCHEPRVAVAVLEAMLQPWRSTGRLETLMQHRPIGAEVRDDRCSAVVLAGPDGAEVRLEGTYVLDATETGELLALAAVEHVVGAEARSDTGEPHAAAVADPDDQQGITVCFAVSHHEGEDHVIPRPEMYDFWRTYRPDFWPGPLLDFTAPDPRTLEPATRTFTPNPPPSAVAADQSADAGDRELWTFRRILARQNLEPGALDSDVVLVNWPMNDYWLRPIVADSAAQRDAALGEARQLSLSLLHWLQTEAPRPDGGAGWPGLRVRPDVTGTPDGLAKAPYIREARRIRAVTTVLEQDVSADLLGVDGLVTRRDSVGVGSYRIDLHPSTAGRDYIDVPSVPFEIPLGALVPIRLRNLLPAGKNLGTTHVSNGCFRLHPVEWNVGEAAGALAAHCIDEGVEPAAVQADDRRFARFAALLEAEGVERRWPVVRGY